MVREVLISLTNSLFGTRNRRLAKVWTLSCQLIRIGFRVRLNPVGSSPVRLVFSPHLLLVRSDVPRRDDPRLCNEVRRLPRSHLHGGQLPKSLWLAARVPSGKVFIGLPPVALASPTFLSRVDMVGECAKDAKQ